MQTTAGLLAGTLLVIIMMAFLSCKSFLLEKLTVAQLAIKLLEICRGPDPGYPHHHTLSLWFILILFFPLCFSSSYVRLIGGRDMPIGTATGYGLDGPGSNPGGWGEIFRTRPDRFWDPPSLLCNGNRVFPGSKAAGAWRWPSTPSNAEVEGRVELYISSPSGPSWPVVGWPLPLPYTPSA